MELLLNLAWVLLAFPAFWLWRDSRSAHGRRFASIQILLTLACMLVILFPIISASDDLIAMRSEMEESPASKRTICQKAGEKASAAKWHTQPAAALLSDFSVLHDEAGPVESLRLFFAAEFRWLDLHPRAPPQPVLA